MAPKQDESALLIDSEKVSARSLMFNNRFRKQEGMPGI
jgi:hypothetical protein